MYLLGIGDVHFGEYGFDYGSEKIFNENLYFIKHNRSKVILMGDLVNAATQYSKASWLSEKEHCQEQIDFMVDKLRPIKNKLLGSILGNHEYNSYKITALSPTYVICHDLKIPYLGFRSIIEVLAGDIKYLVSVYHGRGSSRTLGAKINTLDNRRMYNDADIYMCGHTHNMGIYPVARYIYDPDLKKQVKKNELLVHTGSFLNDTANYANKEDYPPLPLGTPIITLSEKEKKFAGYIEISKFEYLA